MDFTRKQVCVVGTGISGIAAANLLNRQGACVVLYDSNSALDREAVRERLEVKNKTDILSGELPEEVLSRLDLAVLSPGVPADGALAEQFHRAGIPVWGEIELAFQCGRGKIAAITGTNGKTTTTALTGEIMKRYFDSVFVVGNIGIPYTGAVMDMTEDSVTVAEISSFQLETIDQFQPSVSAVLNITPDHLDRHKTMDHYIEVKLSITKNQLAGDACVLNYDDEILQRFGRSLNMKVLFFSSLHKLEKGIYLDEDNIVYSTGRNRQIVCRTDELKLLGRHNHENVMAAVGIGVSMGVPMKLIREAVTDFAAVEHRIEFVTEKNGVAWYNDSKGTNPDAAIKGIQAMNRPTFLIGGGYDKGSSYEQWIRSFDGKVKELVLIGQTKEKIAAAAKKCGFEQVTMAEDLAAAVALCAKKAGEGDAVLLSPACASWGMFRDYEERGRMFKDYVHKL